MKEHLSEGVLSRLTKEYKAKGLVLQKTIRIDLTKKSNQADLEDIKQDEVKQND